MQTIIFDCHRRNYKEEYRNYLDSYHWQLFRKRQRKRFHCCVYCWYWFDKIVVDRDIHHLHYRNRNHEQDEDVVIICHATHTEVTNGQIPASILIEAREAYKRAFPEHKT